MTDTLLKKLLNDRDYSLHETLLPDGASMRLGRLVQIFHRAAEAHDDEAAQRLYGLIMLATDEAHSNGGAPGVERALMATCLYGGLPEFRMSRECVDHETYRMADIRSETLVGLRKRILIDVTRRWNVTPNASEAEHLEDFLVGIAKKRSQREIACLTEAIREATKSISSMDRVVRLAARLQLEAIHEGEHTPYRTLLIGLTRSFPPELALQLSGILSHLPLDDGRRALSKIGPHPIMNALVRDAQAYRAMHDAIERLWAEISRKDSALPVLNIEASYPSLGRANLMIRAVPDGPKKGHEENAFHEMVGRLRDCASAWYRTHQAEHPDVALSISLTVQWSWQGGTSCFRREFRLA